jgi:hypothetical protein
LPLRIPPLTRIFRAGQSTSRQRSASSSPCRSPVIAAVRYIARSTCQPTVARGSEHYRRYVCALTEEEWATGEVERAINRGRPDPRNVAARQQTEG